MALFGKSRDINLFHTINSELLKDIIQTEVAYYKFALEQTTSNVYGESMGKVYYEPMKIACLIDKQNQAWTSDDFGSDVNQTIEFKFLKNELCLQKEAIGDYENKLKDMELEDMIDDKERLRSNSKDNQTHTGHVPFVASSRSDDF